MSLAYFAGIPLISAILTFLIFMIKDEKKEKKVFWFIAPFCMCISFLNAYSVPDDYIHMQLITWAIGGVAAAVLIIRMCVKSRKAILAAQIMAAASMACNALFIFI